MSLLDRIAAANRFDLSGFVPLFIEGVRFGFVRHAFATELRRWPQVFRIEDHGVTLADPLNAASTALERRSAAVLEVCRTLAEEGHLDGWRDEFYPVARRFGEAPALLLERAAVPLFGVSAYGVHLNGFQRDADGHIRMWIGRRAASKPTGPGELDQMVAGGQPHGISLFDNLIKECAEEAGVPQAIARRARPVGAISYILETAHGLRPDMLFNFDLLLPLDFEPSNIDGEVECFYLWDVQQVHEILTSSAQFKFNCALVAIDFMIRHGLLAADHPDYQALVEGLHPSLDLMPRREG